jgi:hypothetical protein
MATTTAQKALKPKMFLVARFENGWDYAPVDRIRFFLDKKEAMTAFKEMVKDSKDDDCGTQHKICVAQVEPGNEIYFSGYGNFVGGKLLKEYDYEG